MRTTITASLLLFLIPSVLAQEATREQRVERYAAVVTSDAARRAIEPLLEHRRSEGLEVEVIGVAAGDRDAARARLAERRPDYVLLVGDVDVLPCYEVRKAATDRPYADYDEDGFPDAAVGRFPTSHPAALAGLVLRTLRYERERAAGAWRKQCALVAGEAKFSPVLDRAIEHTFTKVVCESVNPAYDVDLTYANPSSPYCYPSKRFARRVVERLNEGALIFAYVGHGQVRRVDTLTVPAGKGKSREHSVLEASHARKMKTGGSAPVFISIACWTGKYEGKRPCIGEELLLARGGPVAFIGSSRVSQPVQNALLAKELVRELLADTGLVRVGAALKRAREAMVHGRKDGPDPVRTQVLGLGAMVLGQEAVEREFPRHVDMYNLLGDPALSLARPESWIDMQTETAAQAGEELEVRGTGAIGSELTLTLETARERSARQTPEKESALERYRRVNDKVVWRTTVKVGEDGTFDVKVKLPNHLTKGTYTVKAFAQTEGKAAAGAVGVDVAADPDYDPWEDEAEEDE